MITLPEDKFEFEEAWDGYDFPAFYEAADTDLGDMDYIRGLIKEGFIFKGHTFKHFENDYLLNDFLVGFKFRSETVDYEVFISADCIGKDVPEGTQYTHIYEEYDWRKEGHIQTLADWYSGN
jgi:hypothetical protein